MGRNARDLKEYCEILGVGPGASPEELRLAYVLRKREVQADRSYSVEEVREAYQALADPQGRERSRSEPGPESFSRAVTRERSGPGRQRVHALLLLAACAGMLLGALALYVWPSYGHRLRSFNPNDALIEESTGRRYGTVLEVQERHPFPNGKIGAAYRLRLEPDGREVWYPASDVQYLCVRR